MYILIASLLLPFSASATISYLESYSRPKTSHTAFLAGEIHDADHAGQRQIVKQALVTYAAQSILPLSLQVEDPLAIPGLEQLVPAKGILLGLVNELKGSSLPSHIQVYNFDTKKVANCAIHFFSQSKPIHDVTIPELNELSFGHLITELESVRQWYANQATIQNLGDLAKADCVRQLALIGTNLELLEKNMRNLRISPGDSMAHMAVDLSNKGISLDKIYKPLYQADVQLTSLAAIVATFESKNSMALLCGERHTKDVSRILEYEQWPDLSGPCCFNNNWLLHPSN